MMLSPDLLDRRALALIQMTDIFGRPVEGNVDVDGPGILIVRKSGGRIAITSAEGFAQHESSFTKAPSSPALQSRKLTLEFSPYETRYAARSYQLVLPRDADPANSDQRQSIFAAEIVTLLPDNGLVAAGSTCFLRVEVTRASDGALIENALIRGKSNNDQFTAIATTNHAGEATLVFANIPPSFAGSGASVKRSIDGKVTVDVDPATARFNDPAEIAAAALAASKRKSGHIDPDVMSASIAADFPAGKAVKISAGTSQSLKLKWTQP
ncbi:MAG: hypothetical protein V3V15_01245 [Sphingorhabdus sp.]